MTLLVEHPARRLLLAAALMVLFQLSALAQDSGTLIATLLDPPDKVAERAAATQLGNASIDAALPLTGEQSAGLETYILRCFERAKSKSAEERMEARRQIERLWLAASPALLKQLDNRDPAQLELAIKSLLLMRNETIIEAVIARAMETQDPETKKWTVFMLGKMNEPRKALVSGRECLSPEKSAELFERLVKPALAILTKPEK